MIWGPKMHVYVYIWLWTNIQHPRFIPFCSIKCVKRIRLSQIYCKQRKILNAYVDKEHPQDVYWRCCSKEHPQEKTYYKIHPPEGGMYFIVCFFCIWPPPFGGGGQMQIRGGFRHPLKWPFHFPFQNLNCIATPTFGGVAMYSTQKFLILGVDR